MSAVGGATPCPECERCPACGTVAYCLSEPGATPPCPHDSGLCGDCMLGEDGCAACQQDVEAALRRAFDTFDGDPFQRRDLPADDPLAPAGDTWRRYNEPWREAVRKDKRA